MLIQHRHKENRGIFFIEDDGNIVAEMIYSQPEPGKMIIEHTDVSEEMMGEDVGYELVLHAVQYARLHKLKILPVCLFTKAVFDKKPDFQDVLE
ncbi:MAG: GNAT family N-acetyltransferase [Candidatus Dadabacteria bacterium]